MGYPQAGQPDTKVPGKGLRHATMPNGEAWCQPDGANSQRARSVLRERAEQKTRRGERPPGGGAYRKARGRGAAGVFRRVEALGGSGGESIFRGRTGATGRKAVRPAERAEPGRRRGMFAGLKLSAEPIAGAPARRAGRARTGGGAVAGRGAGLCACVDGRGAVALDLAAVAARPRRRHWRGSSVPWRRSAQGFRQNIERSLESRAEPGAAGRRGAQAERTDRGRAAGAGPTGEAGRAGADGGAMVGPVGRGLPGGRDLGLAGTAGSGRGSSTVPPRGW